jgi:hypothetical protein
MRVQPVAPIALAPVQAAGGLGDGAAGSGRDAWSGADRVVLSAEAFRHAAQGEGAEPAPVVLPMDSGDVVVTAGAAGGTLHIAVRLLPPLTTLNDVTAPGPTAVFEADVRSGWLDNVVRGASTPNEQAVRIARALAELAAVPGQRTVTVHGVVAPGMDWGARIRGPVRPAAPLAWLPAEYPPPPDDPTLVAQVASAGSRNAAA